MNTFPAWRDDGSGFECDDDRQSMHAVACQLMCGFNLPKFDLWAASLPDCPGCGTSAECCLKQEMRGHRKLALEALSANKKDAAFRHLEWMQNRQREYMREQFLLPLAKRGDKTVKSASKGGKAKSVWPARKAELQAAIDAIHKENPDISYEEIKRKAARRHPYPAHALKRYTKNPK